MAVIGIDHVQVAIPPGGEDRARAFYSGVLGMREIEKPAALRPERNGAWFDCGAQGLHLGVDPDFRPSRKGHPAFLVDDLPAALAACEAAGIPSTRDVPLPGYDRAFVHDPFGNRIELMQRIGSAPTPSNEDASD
jgi:catechol 2,3-dioxygenase-like lactoylglutathione lyase family enzyme